MSNKRSKLQFWGWFLGGLGILGGLAGLVIYAKSSGILESMTSVQAFQEYILSFGAKSSITFFIIQFLSVVLAPIPSNVSAAAGGAIFGTWEAFFISTAAILCGSIAVFFLARKLGKPFADRLISPQLAAKYGKAIAAKSDILLILMFTLPFFPDDAICILAGLSKMKWSRFFVIALLTRPWGILAASAVGSQDLVIPWWGWIAVAAAVTVLYMLVSNYRKKISYQAS